MKPHVSIAARHRQHPLHLLRLLPCLPACAFVVALAATGTAAQAQRSTERFIPIGQSPGVSGKTAMMGTVVGYADGMLTLSSPASAAPQRVRMQSDTLIWVDRSAQQQTNTRGTAADLQPGRRIEIKFVDPATRAAAAWVKVQAP